MHIDLLIAYASLIHIVVNITHTDNNYNHIVGPLSYMYM